MNKEKQKILISLKKAQTLISRVIKMVEKDQYCIETMTQNLAVIGLLRSAHEKLMNNHLESCFKNALESRNKKKQDQMTKEILKVTKLFNK